ncbi:alpha/beta fold hydrolase [Actinoplanes sp. CA-142083]|uniref:alpha/beta fold hydrolase n=1 Tax=Actinoplanes sp. CA-142083 TaxID=3239903 RepID=UPI003D8F3D4D
MLLVHGFGSSFANDWRRNGWVDVLADLGRTVVGRDLLGHAGPAPGGYEGLEEHAFSSAAGLVPVDAIGFSMGGLILLRLAADDPSRFRRLVILGVGDTVTGLAEPDPARPLPDVMGTLDGTATAADPASEVFRRLVSAPRADRGALAGVLRRPQRPLTPVDLSRITNPTLLVIGEDDFAGPATRLAERLPDASLVVLPRTDHFATPSSMKAMNAALAFIEQS